MTKNLEDSAGAAVDIEDAAREASEDVQSQRGRRPWRNACQSRDIKRNAWWIRCSLR